MRWKTMKVLVEMVSMNPVVESVKDVLLKLRIQFVKFSLSIKIVTGRTFQES